MFEMKKSMSQKLKMDGRDDSAPWCYFWILGAGFHKLLFGKVENGWRDVC
jgi:hypothetical protein